MRAIGIVCLLASTLAPFVGAHAAPIDTARAKGLGYLISNQRGDGSWNSGAGGLEVQATSAAIEAFQGSGLRKSPQFSAGVSWLNNAETGTPASTSALMRRALASVLPVSALLSQDTPAENCGDLRRP